MCTRVRCINGFINTNTPSICGCGILYNSCPGNLCDFKMAMIMQNINESGQNCDSSDPIYWTIPDTQHTKNGTLSTGSITTSSALIKQIFN